MFKPSRFLKCFQTSFAISPSMNRFSTVLEISQESPPEVDLRSFVKSASSDLEGPYHCWLSRVDALEGFFKNDRTFLVFADMLPEETQLLGSNPFIMIEKLKLFQQRYPLLNVMGFQSGTSACSAANKTRLSHSIMKEYITFPILLSNKTIAEANGPCYILFKDSADPLVYLERDVDLGTLIKAIEDMNMLQSGNSFLNNNSKGTSLKRIDVAKEPYASLYLRNMVLHFPSCIDVDEDEHRLFLSDSHHHRIIILDADGKILDSIGSSPGFEDGDFETAKLARPAASFYDAVDNYLYFADSENHAIRRADLNKRVIETLYPSSNTNIKNNGVFTWIMNTLGMEREADASPEESDSDPLMFPWHLIRSPDNNLLIINRSFEMLWIMDLTSGKVKEIVKGFPKIREICGQVIEEKLSLLRKIPHDLLQKHIVRNSSVDWIPYADLVSSFTSFGDHIIICDTAGQRVLKFNCKSGIFSNMKFSNIGILGLPYWLASSLEKVYVNGNVVLGTHVDHAQSFSFLPGRVDIRINIDIPVDTDLVEPLQGGCVWRQARGAAAVILEPDDVTASSEKAGVAQQWYDELDTLAFMPPTPDSTDEENKSKISNTIDEFDKPRIDCAVNTSPGTSEVIIYAALYLKLKRSQNPDLDNPGHYAARIENILNPERSSSSSRDLFIASLSNLKGDLSDYIFMKPLHVRIKLNTLDHPKAENSKDFILTDTSIEVNVPAFNS